MFYLKDWLCRQRYDFWDGFVLVLREMKGVLAEAHGHALQLAVWPRLISGTGA